jgi:hypothetical protein
MDQTADSPDPLTTEVASAVLVPVTDMLRADGYGLEVRVQGTALELTVSAGPDACAECLVPPAVFTGVVRSTLAKAGYQISTERIGLTYPRLHA